MNLGQNKEALTQIAQSGDAQRLMELLNQNGEMQSAAKSAAGGDISSLMGMVKSLMNSQEGAELINRIGRQAKDSGITQE